MEVGWGRFETRHRCKDGRIVDVEISVNYIDAGGGRLFVFARDITERKQAEEKLIKSESLLKEAQHVASIGHWELDPAVGAPTWSEEIFHIFGLDPAQGEPSFKDHQKIIHPDDWNILNNAVTMASAEGVPFDIEFRLLRPDRSIRWMNAKGYSIKDSEGHIVRIFGTAQDITECKRAEEALRETRRL
jgi:PAS domain S-box-containing protein